MHIYVNASNFKYPITFIPVHKNLIREVASDLIFGGARFVKNSPLARRILFSFVVPSKSLVSRMLNPGE